MIDDETTPGAGASSLESGTPGIPGGGEGEEVTRLRSENTRLRQNLAENEKISTRAVPFVRLGQALINAPGGKEIVEKLQKGEPLTKAEEKKVEKTAEAEAVPLTKGEAEKLFDKKMQETSVKFGETVAAQRKADESLKALDERGAKELEGYNDLKRDPQFQGWINSVMEQLRQEQNEPGTGLKLPKDEPDVWWFAVKTAHRIAHAVAGKPFKKGKGEAERVAEALAAGGARPSSATTSGSDIPEEIRGEVERIRGYSNPLIAGKSFGNPKAK